MTIASHHQEVGGQVCGERQEIVRHISFSERDTPQLDFKSVAGKVLGDIRAGQLITFAFLSNHSNHVDLFHECLNIVEQGESFAIACRKCNQDFGLADRNYKDACFYNMVDKDDLTELPPPGGRHSLGRYVEYYCPGCATLLEVETTVPHVEAVIEAVWDIEIAPASITNAAEQARRSVPSAAE